VGDRERWRVGGEEHQVAWLEGLPRHQLALLGLEVGDAVQGDAERVVSAVAAADGPHTRRITTVAASAANLAQSTDVNDQEGEVACWSAGTRRTASPAMPIHEPTVDD